METPPSMRVSGARAAHFGEEGEELLLELLELPLSNSMEEERWRLEEGVEEHETAPLACHTTPPPPLPPSVVRSPWWAWPMLALSVCAVSSAGAAFKSFHSQHVPPVLLASWRLQVTSYVLLPLALMQLRNMPSSDRRRLFATSAADTQHTDTPSHPSPSISAAPLLILAASGACLAVHFGGWVWGIEHTSLPHSLLFVSFTPVLLACGAAALGQPTSLGEVLGTALGVGGSVLLLMDVPRDDGGDGGVSLAGDAASLLASLAFIGYITAGRHLRSWLPVFVYAVPVTYCAAVFMAGYSLLVEGASIVHPFSVHPPGVLGWLQPQYLPRVLYLGVVPGVMGHTNFNMLLKYVPPLVVTLALNLEPALGSLAGWAVGVAAAPGPWTAVGGVAMLLATMVVSSAAAAREAAAAAARGDGEQELGAEDAAELPCTPSHSSKRYCRLQEESPGTPASRGGGVGDSNAATGK